MSHVSRGHSPPGTGTVRIAATRLLLAGYQRSGRMDLHAQISDSRPVKWK